MSFELANIFALIKQERKRQDDKWGEQNHDHFIWNAIFGEEVGEVAKAICDERFSKDILIAGHHAHIAVELVQSAAVAVAWLECMSRHGLIDLHFLDLDA